MVCALGAVAVDVRDAELFKQLVHGDMRTQKIRGRVPLVIAPLNVVLHLYDRTDVEAFLSRVKAQLAPGGSLVFCEHGKAPDPGVQSWQNRVNPLWRVLFGGCNLNRDIPAVLEEGGFRVGSLEQSYLPGTPRFAGYNFWGMARRA